MPLANFSNLYKLPKEIQEILVNPDNADKLVEITKPFKLSEKQIDKMHDLTVDVLIGQLAPNRFIAILSEKAGIPLETSKQIAYKISEVFFFPVKELIKKMYEV